MALVGNDDATTLPLNQAAAGEATVVALHEKSIKDCQAFTWLKCQLSASPVTWHSGCSGSDRACAELATCRLATAARRRRRQ